MGARDAASRAEAEASHKVGEAEGLRILAMSLLTYPAFVIFTRMSVCGVRATGLFAWYVQNMTSAEK